MIKPGREWELVILLFIGKISFLKISLLKRITCLGLKELYLFPFLLDLTADMAHASLKLSICHGFFYQFHCPIGIQVHLLINKLLTFHLFWINGCAFRWLIKFLKSPEGTVRVIGGLRDIPDLRMATQILSTGGLWTGSGRDVMLAGMWWFNGSIVFSIPKP